MTAEFETKLCEALGVDPHGTRKIEITVEAGHAPLVFVTRFTGEAAEGHLIEALDGYQLVPVRPQVEHSTDGGKTWAVIDVAPGSVVANSRLDKPLDDGFGNLYRAVAS